MVEWGFISAQEYHKIYNKLQSWKNKGVLQGSMFTRFISDIFDLFIRTFRNTLGVSIEI